MESCWRWFGPNDKVSLTEAREAGATGLVTALHDISYTRAWTVDEIEVRKNLIAAAGTQWSACESIPIPTIIETGGRGAEQAIGIWIDTLVNLAKAGVATICYNFMPVVDWTRTDLRYLVPSGALALRFDFIDFVAYDAFILGRSTASGGYTPDLPSQAEGRFSAMSESYRARLDSNIIAGLPGGQDSYGREDLRKESARFEGIDVEQLRSNLGDFLKRVAPVAEEVGARLAIHPDDPTMSLFGLPRIISTAADMRKLLSLVDEKANGVTLCVGSLASRNESDVLSIARDMIDWIHFAHLRDVTTEADGSFIEAVHLEGRSDTYGILSLLLAEEGRRMGAGRDDHLIPMHPDHGHFIADDIGKSVNPGYSLIGRLKGLAELPGMIHALERQQTFCGSEMAAR